MELRRTHAGGARGLESAMGGHRAVDPAADWSRTSGSGNNKEAVDRTTFRLTHQFSAAFRPPISH
jgi:hypothetical protein